MEVIIQLLEEKGYHYNEELRGLKISGIITAELAKSKKGMRVDPVEMAKIRTNIDEINHHDAVNIDQILTRIENTAEKDYQWGSLVLNKKWKIISE